MNGNRVLDGRADTLFLQMVAEFISLFTLNDIKVINSLTMGPLHGQYQGKPGQRLLVQTGEVTACGIK